MRPSLNKKSSSASMMMMSNSAFIPKEIRYLVHLCTPQYNSIMVNKFKWVEISIRVSPHNQFFSKIPPTYFLDYGIKRKMNIGVNCHSKIVVPISNGIIPNQHI